MKKLRLLPLLLLVATLSFVFRVGEVVSGFRTLPGAVMAEEKKSEQKESKKEPEKKIEKEKTEQKVDDKTEDKSEKKKEEDISWPDPAEMDPDLAEVRADLLKDLSTRRKQLDQREKDLSTREAVIKAAESEIDQKYRELIELQKQLKNLLNQQSEAEAERMKSLVRIYEGMKPAEAARIFNTLDLSILLDVMTRMSERKSAPILAAMDSDRARTVTLMMAQQKKLPDLPELVAPEAGEPSSSPMEEDEQSKVNVY